MKENRDIVFVQPKEVTTLLINSLFLPVLKCFLPAKAAIRRILSSGANFRAVDANGNLLDWQSWIDKTIAAYPENQPFMRGGSKDEDGSQIAYPVPTILKCSDKIFRSKKGEKISLSNLYRKYK